MKLAELKKEFEKYIVIKDPTILDVIFATLLGNTMMIKREPIWIMLVAPSSGGKTTFIAPCIKAPNTKFVDDMSEKTLLSGFKGAKGERSKSLLDEIGINGTIIFSDFTAMLSKNPTSRGEILGQLRMVYDGTFIKRTGLGEISWTGKMGFIGASTPQIYELLEQGKALGERFTYYCLTQPTDEEIAEKQRDCKISSKEVTDIMASAYSELVRETRFYLQTNGVPDLILNEDQEKILKQCAIFATNGKATVHTDYKTGKIDGMPHKAGVGRDIKMFKSLLHSLQCLHAFETENFGATLTENDMNIIKKCAYSSVNRERRKILEILAKEPDGLTASDIGTREGLGLDKDAVIMHLSPLHSVGLIHKEAGGRGTAHKFKISNNDLRVFVLEASELIKDKAINHASVDDEVIASEEEANADWDEI